MELYQEKKSKKKVRRIYSKTMLFRMSILRSASLAEQYAVAGSQMFGDMN